MSGLEFNSFHSGIRRRCWRVHGSSFFIEARIEGADFSGAALCGAWMQNLPLRAANLIHTNFKEAILEGSDLECVEKPRALFKKANLRSALLTDSVMPDSDFRETILCDAGDRYLSERFWDEI